MIEPSPVIVAAAALVVGLCVGSFGSGITRCAHEPPPKLPMFIPL